MCVRLLASVLRFGLIYNNAGWSRVSLHVGTEQAVCVECNIKVRLRNNCSHSKAISITYSRWVLLAFIIQQEKRMSCIKLSSVSVWLYHILVFLYCLITGTIFGKKILQIVCVWTFSTTFV